MRGVPGGFSLCGCDFGGTGFVFRQCGFGAPRAFNRGEGGKVVGALKVGMTVWQTRDFEGGTRGGCLRAEAGGNSQCGDENKKRKPPMLFHRIFFYKKGPRKQNDRMHS